jgi:hypothetical protein
MFFWSGLHTTEKGRSILIYHLAIHYALYLGFVIFGHPEEEVSIGLHERIGPCNQTVPIHTVFGTVCIFSSLARMVTFCSLRGGGCFENQLGHKLS